MNRTIEDRITLIESELNCARNAKDATTEYLHLERAKNELQMALYVSWHKQYTSGVPYRTEEVA